MQFFLHRPFHALLLWLTWQLIFPALPALSQTPPTPEVVTVWGTVAQAKNILISIDITENPISGKIVGYASKIDSSGKFMIQLPLKTPTYGWLFHANNSVPVFLHPGDNVQVTVNAQDMASTVKFEGRGADHCRLTAGYFRKFNTAAQRSLLTQKMGDLEPADFIAYVDDIRKQKLQLLADYKVKGSLSQVCENFVKTQTNVEWANALLDYPFAHSLKSDELTPDNLPPDYYAFMDEVDLQNQEALQLSIYTDYLLKFISNRFSKTIDRADYNTDNFYADKFEFTKTLLSGKALYYVQGICITDACTYGKVENIAAKFDEYLVACPFTNYTQAVTEVYDRAFRTSAGQQAPDFSLINLAGDTLTLQQLKGKVLYVDFWATWCGPCVREMGYSEQLKEKFTGKNVAFVYISVDDNPMDWEYYLHNTLLYTPDSTLHLFANGLTSETGKNYNIKGVPRYLIIDADGIIADSNAKRPSDPGVVADLEKVLNRSLLPNSGNN
ncbi:TlpA family protein disulfide reductase [Sphingobacteriales bacterium UPWRP_1]|nr:hypothetical protein BVG80_17710 [Sphingobacteriales bacterium TSM_CSM]PSJ71861.1 TlpA family protein disulfide reductase [Sphingobacteriales bacterium UPWRP_1]